MSNRTSLTVIPGANQLFLREEELRLGIDLIYFAARDLATEVEGLARRLSTEESTISSSHLRLLSFLRGEAPQPSARVMRLMRQSKQSFSRTCSVLVARDWILQAPLAEDRRQHHLSLTQAGRELEAQVAARLNGALARAYRQAGATAVTGMREVLLGLVSDAEALRYLQVCPPFPCLREAGGSLT
ncbi:MAG: helix-turn-helix domain-containing protein, partial [Alphaproteobacteria bacterium]|nr:helix-turn-helix domain-containing protein [Alphaproteobacteria bacterium]